MTTLTGAGCRAGRAILKWSTRDLAAKAGVSPATVNLIEADRPFRPGTARKILDAFAEHDVQLSNGDSPGARLRMRRLDLHRAMEEIIEARAYGREVRGDAEAVCKQVAADLRVSADQMPRALCELIPEIVPGAAAWNYGQAATLLLA